ncbi:hypothetical protein IJI94_01955 [Candidatus Saccharibacteria bacterium]|nr:hypothetical protein [Candidatus Saccharibacteria bacterium]
MENEVRIDEKKDTTKEKVILFIIGVLVGAVISTAAFLVFTKTLGTSSNDNSSSSQQMQGGTPPEMPSDNGSNSGQGGTPPEMPSGNNSQNSSN